MSAQRTVELVLLGPHRTRWRRIEQATFGLDAVRLFYAERLRDAFPRLVPRTPAVFVVDEALGYHNIVRLLAGWAGRRHTPQTLVITDLMGERSRWNLLSLGVTACLPIEDLTRSDLEYLVGRARIVPPRHRLSA